MEVIVTSPEQIKEILAQVLKELIPQSTPTEIKKDSERFLTRKEIRDLFNISFPTIRLHTKKGNLKAYNFGRRVLYKESEIQSALIPFQQVLRKKVA